MNQSRMNPFSRRAALKAAAGCGLMSNTALMSQFLNLQAMKAMAAASNTDGYRAVVCVFLAGAIDSFNVLAPIEGMGIADPNGAPFAGHSGEYKSYLIARNGPRTAGNPGAPGYNSAGLALREEDFENTTINEGTAGVNQGGRQFGLHPGCAIEADPDTVDQNAATGAPDYLLRGLHGSDKGIAGLYKEGALAFVANVGSLPYKITRAEYNSNAFRNGKPARPLGLFSHSDLQRHWQTSVPQSRAQVNGWGGRLADCFQQTNGEASVSMNMSVNGVNLFQTGTDVIPYTVGIGAEATGAGGANELNDYGLTNNYQRRAFNALTDNILNQTYSNLVAESFRTQNLSAIQAAIDFNSATSYVRINETGSGNGIQLSTPFEFGGGGNSDLGRRLRQVAKIIGASHPSVNTGGPKLNQTRQVFFVQEGGWDHHADMVSSMHDKMHEVSKALTSFYRVLEEMGVEADVVTFTASDFGRTLRTNGIGSDHGWGGNHIIMGGGMKANGSGGRIYGSYPEALAVPVDPYVGHLDVGQRRLIPTTAVDEFAAEIARWFGITNQADLSIVLPNVGEFYNIDGASRGPLGML